MAATALRRAFLPSFEILVFILVFWTGLLFMPDMLNSDGDLGRHITVGGYILDERAIPTSDVFSETRYGEPLVLHEWLSEVIFALAARGGGLNGVGWLTAGLLAVTYAALALGLRLLGVSAPLAFVAAFASFLTGAIHHLPRPHLFSLLFFTLLVLLLELYRRQPRPGYLLLALPLVALWANFNGAFVLAFSVVGIYLVGALLERDLRRAGMLALVLVGCLLAALVNPYGAGLLEHVLGFMGNRFLVDNTVEYLSPDFHNLNAWLFGVWILLSLALCARTTAPVPWTPLLLLCAWTAFGLYSARNIPNYAQVAAIVLAPLGAIWLATHAPAVNLRLTNLDRFAPIGGGWVWAVGVVVGLVLLQSGGMNLDARARGNAFNNTTFPIKAVDALAADPPEGNVFNEYTWGGYLLYRLYPRQRVFIDGDNDFYGEALVRDYLDMVNARAGWQEDLEHYKVRWVILPPDRPLAQQLNRSGEWRELYRDATAGVWVKQ